MGALKRLAALAIGLAAMSSMASAYYYWMFLGSGTGTLVPLPGRFDLTALQDNTVQYFISSTGPAVLVSDDTATALYSQIRQAAAVWNNVRTSSLRLAYGGIRTVTTPQVTPGIDVVFDDTNMPPGILAQSAPTFPADLSFLASKDAAFVPILRSRLQLRANLAVAGMEQPSYSDTVFLTLVHEFGHTLGLQHTLTSSVMSTSLTRGTMKGSPLAADDIAGISLLYPVSGYAATTGTIAGSVQVNGAAVNMASVVALSPNGTAVSALTRPDGTYRIDGIPPGQYYVYAHPLPPAQSGEARAANIVPPVNPAGGDYSANLGFDTQFFPGTKDWTQAALVTVTAGTSVPNVNFAMSPRTAPLIYGIETYGYRPQAVAAPPLLGGTSGNPIVFTGAGVIWQSPFGTTIMPGLNVSVVGGAAAIEPFTLGYYTGSYLLMRVDTAKVAAPTPVALALTLGDELYVLPSAFTVEPTDLPAITHVTAGTAADGVTATATISGTNLGPSTRIQFDGADAPVTGVNTDGTWVVLPPPAPSALQSTVEAVDANGQTSLQGQLLTGRPTYTYAKRDDPSIKVLPSSLIAGTDGFAVIFGTNTHFTQGQTVAGFGTSDISVRQLWVLNPGFVVVNLTMHPQVTIGSFPVTITTGLESITLPDAISTTPAAASQMSMHVPVVNAVTGLAGVPAGGTALIRTTGLPSDLTGWQVAIGGIAAQFSVDKNGVMSVIVPSNLAVGAQLVQMSKADGTGPQPIIMQVDPPPPVIVAAVDNTANGGKGVAVSVNAPAVGGDSISLTVTGLDWTPGVWINVAGTNLSPAAIAPPDKDGNWTVTFTLPAVLPYDPKATQQSVPVMVGIGTRLSAPFVLPTHVDPPPPPAAS